MIGDKSQGFSDMDVTGRDAEVFVTSSATVTTYALAVYERVLRIILSNGNALAVTLPPVSAAVGKTYSIRVITDGGSSATVDDAGDDPQQSQATLADDEDGVVYWSDGRNWWLMASNGI